jgi:hypothetical protein
MTATAPRTFFAECYVPGLRSTDVEKSVGLARAAAAELRDEGREVAYVRAIHVPDDEVVFHVFEASDGAVAREAARRSGLPFERVVESVSIGGPSGEPRPESAPKRFRIATHETRDRRTR